MPKNLLTSDKKENKRSNHSHLLTLMFLSWLTVQLCGVNLASIHEMDFYKFLIGFCGNPIRLSIQIKEVEEIKRHSFAYSFYSSSLTSDKKENERSNHSQTKAHQL